MRYKNKTLIILLLISTAFVSGCASNQIEYAQEEVAKEALIKTEDDLCFLERRELIGLKRVQENLSLPLIRVSYFPISCIEFKKTSI